MGKWAKYDKAFQAAWLKDPLFEKWIEECKTDKTKAYCKVCKSVIRAHKTDLKKHGEAAKHKQNMSTVCPKQPSLKTFSKVEKVTVLELKLAVYVACHSSINTIDHLCDILKKNVPSTSSSDTMRLHRTKCTALIKKVISPELLNDLVSDLKNVSFSLIIDESTDIACAKHLCVCVRYYSKKHSRIISQFVGLISVTSTTAEALYLHIKNYFREIDVDLNYCIALGTDGASNLCGRRQSVYALMKKDIPNLLLIKCTCHSLHLACCHASEELPSHIDYMLRETYNWFHRSALRKEAYLEIYKLINDGKEPLQLVPLSGTRWLARSNSVKRVLDQWDSLKTHFLLASSSHDRYSARELHNMFSDHLNQLYFIFMKPILNDFERLNLLFQKEEADHCSLLSELEAFTLTILRRVLHPGCVKLEADMTLTSTFLPLNRVDFGHEFSSLLANKRKDNLISDEDFHNIQSRCHAFLIRASKELINRLPENREIFKKIKNLSPSVCLSHTRPQFSELPLALANQSKITDIESQWRKLLTLDWNSICNGNVPSSGSMFWAIADTVKDAGGEFVLRDLAEFALKAYSLPISNALVERVFSRVTSVKTKLRNRLGLELLTSILRIKTSLDLHGKCCVSFEPSRAMLNFDSSIYNYKQEESDEQEEELVNDLLCEP